MRSCLSLLAVILVTSQLTAGSAAAQSWFEAPPPPNAPGVRLGDLRLHAGVGTDVGWISNVFLADQAQASGALRVAPHLEVATLAPPAQVSEAPGPQTAASHSLQFQARLAGAFKHYLATDADSDVAVGQDMRLSLRAGSMVGIDAFEEFQRTIDPFTDPLPPPTGSGVPSYARDRLGVGTRLQFATVGEVLKTGLAYRLDVDHFEDAVFRDDRSLTNSLAADASWEFYPRTALFFRGEVGFRAYSGLGDSPRASRADSTHVESRAGLNGAITPRLGVTVALGYAAALVANGHDYDTWLGQLEARWRILDPLSWLLAVERGLGPAFQGDYASVNRIKTRLDLEMGALSLALKAELSFIGYGRDAVLATAGADAERDDILLRTQLSGEYRFVTWLAVTAEVGYVKNFSDFVFPVMGSNGDAAAYSQLQAWLGVRAFL